MKRREILKGLTLLPFAASASSLNASASESALSSETVKNVLKTRDAALVKQGEALLRSLGVEPFINCKGTNTVIGGSYVRPEVKEAMESVSTLSVGVDALTEGVGKRLAELTGAEWGIVTACTTASIKLAMAACLTDGDSEKLLQLPDVTGFTKTEVIVPKAAKNVFDRALRAAGAKMVIVDSIEELKSKISSKTAMIYTLAECPEPLSISSMSKVVKSMNIPIFVDAAAFIITVPNVHIQEGADLVAYSGSKGLKAPGSTGLLLGRKDLLMATNKANSPGSLFGRDNKVTREEQIGMLTAVDSFVKRDHKAEMNMWVSWLEHINSRVSNLNGLKTTITRPDAKLIDHVTPYLHITWDPAQLHVTGKELTEELLRIRPCVAVTPMADKPGLTGITLVGYMMLPGNDKIVGERLYQAFTVKRSPKTAKG